VSCSEIYLVRHAIAAERGPEWPDDSKRPLTARGIARFTQAVAGLAHLGVTVDVIFTSPLVRARQTAQLLAAGLGENLPIKVLESLAPGHQPAAVIRELAKAATASRVALVGHEPGLGDLAAHLIGGSRALPFKKGGACRIDVGSPASRHPGELQWFLTPKILRDLGQC
jgi:phosphohistidine phosphatase